MYLHADVELQRTLQQSLAETITITEPPRRPKTSCQQQTKADPQPPIPVELTTADAQRFLDQYFQSLQSESVADFLMKDNKLQLQAALLFQEYWQKLP